MDQICLNIIVKLLHVKTFFINYDIKNSLEAGPDPHAGAGVAGVDESLARVHGLGVGSIPECGEFALERPAGLRRRGVEDGVRGAEVRPVGVEQLHAEAVLGAEGGAVHHVGHLALAAPRHLGQLHLHAAPRRLPHLQRGVEARVGGLEAGLDNLQGTRNDGSGGASNTKTR